MLAAPVRGLRSTVLPQSVTLTLRPDFQSKHCRTSLRPLHFAAPCAAGKVAALPGKEHRDARSAEGQRDEEVLLVRGRGCILTDICRSPREETQPKTKWRCGDEDCALVSIGGIFGGGIADARDGNGAECV